VKIAIQNYHQDCKLYNQWNCKGFSGLFTSICQILKDYKFWNWFAGVLDGDGNFDIRKSSNGKKLLNKLELNYITEILEY